MKRIIVAIDFSKGSIHALNYARQIADKLAADITMVWVDSECGISSFSPTPAADNEYRSEAIRNFKELMTVHKKEGSTAQIEYKLRRGKVYQEVAQLARQLKADLIIAGTHGVTGFEEFWIGSNAYRIVSYAPCPVITVRFDYFTDGAFRDIVLPIDSTNDTKQKVPFTNEIAKALNAKIHILGLHSTGLKSMHKKMLSNMDAVIKICNRQGIQFESNEIESKDITKAITSYAMDVHADLIAIMTEQERSASSILLGPQAQQLVNYSKVPVLSIQPLEISTLMVR